MFHIKDKRALQLKINGSNPSYSYSKFRIFLDSIPETVEISDFEWWIPDWYIDDYMKEFGDWTCMTQTVASIKGNEKIIIPEFNIDNKHLEDFNLEPFPFQKVGISFLREIKSGILGDSMGLGK